LNFPRFLGPLAAQWQLNGSLNLEKIWKKININTIGHKQGEK